MTNLKQKNQINKQHFGELLLDKLYTSAQKKEKLNIGIENSQLSKKTKKKTNNTFLSNRIHNICEDEREKKTWRSVYNCSNQLNYKDGKFIGSRCNRKRCLICSSIKTAQNYVAYEPELKKFSNPVLLTLTTRSANGDGRYLRKKLNNTAKLFSHCVQTAKRKGYKVKAIRVIETTTNSEIDKYHVHIHAIIDNVKLAEMIKFLWIRDAYKFYFTVNKDFQDITPITGMNGLKEVFKYPAKIFDRKKNTIDFKGLEYYYRVSKNFKSIQPYGIKKHKIKLSQLEESNIIRATQREISTIQDNDTLEYIHGRDIGYYGYANTRTGEEVSRHVLTNKEQGYYLNNEDIEDVKIDNSDIENMSYRELEKNLKL